MKPSLITHDTDTDVVTMSSDAYLQRESLLIMANFTESIANQIDADCALLLLKDITAFTTDIETQRVSVKAPFIDIGKKIDALAKDLTASVKDHGSRISRMLGEFEKVKRDKIEDARRAADAETSRLELEARKAAASVYRKAQDQLEGARAADTIIETAMVAAVKVKQDAIAVAETKTEGALRGKPDFEVVDITAFYISNPELCKVEVNRQALVSVVRQNPNIQFPGLRVWWDHKLSVK